MLKGERVATDFYPFVENEGSPEETGAPEAIAASSPARVAVYDDVSAAPRVVVIEPGEVRGYLEEITATVSRLSKEQGGSIPFMVIREIVENFIHAYFRSPTISILDGGNTIRFSDQGPGIQEKSRALEFGTTSATEEMKRYIRGVGSGLPYVQQYMEDKGGSLEVEDNIAGGTVVTISTRPRKEAREVAGAGRGEKDGRRDDVYEAGSVAPMPVAAPTAWPWPVAPQQAPWPQQAHPYQQAPWPQQVVAQPASPWQPTAAPAPGAQPPAGASLPSLSLDERSLQVLDYLSTRESVGPTDLVGAYGSSGATWSRVLSALSAQGLVAKRGQKYHLTGVGRAFV